MSENVTDAFLETLASCADTCADLDLSDDGWMPPDGNYDVELTNIQTGEGKKTPGVWVKPTFTVLDGDFEGKTFTDYFFIVPNADPEVWKEVAPLKRMAQLATCLAGREVKDAVESIGIIDAAAGEEFLSVEVYRTKSKKNGKMYSNLRFLNRIESSEIGEVETADVEPAVAE